MRELFLEKMAKENGWKYGVEVGVWYGRTFFHLLDTVPGLVLFGVDIWIQSDKNVHHVDQAENRKCVYARAKLYEGANILEMPSLEAAKQFPGESIDFVFIDADHSYLAVLDDISAWSPKVKVGGWVTGHDWDWQTVGDAVNTALPGATSGKKENDYVWVWIKP
jgi:hypothetical protein